MEWRQRSRAPVKDIASLHGQLPFIACIVKPGRIFLWRIVEEMQRGQTMESQVQLSEEFFSELDWWIQLLPEWNGVSIIPEFQWVSNADFDLFTDASGIRFGTCWQGAWLAGEFMDWACEESMAFKELFAIMMAVATWGSRWQGKKVRFFCNNKSVCHMLHFKNSRRPHLAALLRTLYALLAQFFFGALSLHVICWV